MLRVDCWESGFGEAGPRCPETASKKFENTSYMERIRSAKTVIHKIATFRASSGWTNPCTLYLTFYASTVKPARKEDAPAVGVRLRGHGGDVGAVRGGDDLRDLRDVAWLAAVLDETA